jgi:hypothetical protein
VIPNKPPIAAAIAREFLNSSVIAATPVRRGRAVQVDPMKPTLNPIGTKPLKLKYDELLPKFAFKFNLRRYTEAPSCLRSGWPSGTTVRTTRRGGGTWGPRTRPSSAQKTNRRYALPPSQSSFGD